MTEFAELTATSRPSIARNFERALGQSPMQYLTDWRLTLARDYLLAGELTLEQIADHVELAPGQWAATALVEEVDSNLDSQLAGL